MNKERRNRLTAVLEDLQANTAANITDLECLLEEEQEAFDNMPEGLQESERGDRMQEAIDAIQEAIDALNQALDDVEGQIETAKE